MMCNGECIMYMVRLCVVLGRREPKADSLGKGVATQALHIIDCYTLLILFTDVENCNSVIHLIKE